MNIALNLFFLLKVISVKNVLSAIDFLIMSLNLKIPLLIVLMISKSEKICLLKSYVLEDHGCIQNQCQKKAILKLESTTIHVKLMAWPDR